MKQFFNGTDAIVAQALLGTVSANADANLEVLDALPHIKVALRKERDPNKVAILSGGGSGHEPAHLGFVGKGMLTGAIAGEVFASPSVDAVLAAIVHASGPAGCLLIVKNYTGDRLNFGLAAERAKALGYKVEMIIVQDDISIPDSKQPRGIAGTLFVHKMAGYLSEKGTSLEEMCDHLRPLAHSICSIGVAYSTCDLPGYAGDPASASPSAELGLGIHGEAGVAVFEPESSADTAGRVVERLKPHLSDDGARYCLLLNNLGSCSNLELSVILRDILASEIGERISHVCGPHTFMTALNMYGYSVSLVPVDDTLIEGLSEPTDVAWWHAPTRTGSPDLVPIPKVLEKVSYASDPDPEVDRVVSTLCSSIIAMEAKLNELDAIVGDGDTGLTFANGARSVLARKERGELPQANLGNMFHAISDDLSTSMGGSSGVLMALFFSSTGTALRSGLTMGEAIETGIASVCVYGGAKLGDRTMLDAAIPAAQCLLDGKGLKAAARAAADGAKATGSMTTANAGRSSYLREETLRGIIDPGAQAVADIFAVLAETIVENGSGPSNVSELVG